MKKKALVATLLTAVVIPAVKTILGRKKKKNKDWRSVL